MIFTSNRFTFFITPVVSFVGWLQADAKPEVAIPKSIEPFFENYCLDCHDADTTKADLDLGTYPVHRRCYGCPTLAGYSRSAKLR